MSQNSLTKLKRTAVGICRICGKKMQKPLWSGGGGYYCSAVCMEARPKRLQEKAARRKTKPKSRKRLAVVQTKRGEGVNYNAYINSAAWQRKRQEALRVAGCECEDCGVTENLHVHHLTYERLGNELLSDLRVLCGGGEPRKSARGLGGCHADRHDTEPLWIGDRYMIVGRPEGFYVVRRWDKKPLVGQPVFSWLALAATFARGADSVAGYSPKIVLQSV